MQDIRMRFEMPLTGAPQQPAAQQQNHQSTHFGANTIGPFSQQQQPHLLQPHQQQRPMNLYSKTNHHGVILSTSNLFANQNTMNNHSNHNINNNNNNNSPVIEGKGKPGEVLLPSKIHPASVLGVTESSAAGDMHSNHNHLIKLKAIANSFAPNSPISSEEDNSPTEMNNCRRMMDKPPLVKRLTMGLLMKTTEDSRPLVYNTHNSMNNNSYNNNHNNNNNNSPSASSTTGTTTTTPGKGSSANCDGYVNEGICDRDRVITNKFGDSCRQSLMAIHQLENNGSSSPNQEFNFKKNLLRETSSANSSPKTFPNIIYKTRVDYLTPTEQQELKGAAWFQAGIPREISLEVLTKQNPGAFIVRQSSSKPGCFALSLRVPPPSPKVAHYLILRTARGYKIKGFTKEFSSLRALITHHSVMPELLPVPLSLPRQMLPQHPRELDDLDSYSSLTDFRKMMSDLNV